MGASRTGSGKTLSYLVPIIEKLYINKWTPLDGLGALVILPTRELVFFLFIKKFNYFFFKKKRLFKCLKFLIRLHNFMIFQ